MIILQVCSKYNVLPLYLPPLIQAYYYEHKIHVEHLVTIITAIIKLL